MVSATLRIKLVRIKLLLQNTNLWCQKVLKVIVIS